MIQETGLYEVEVKLNTRKPRSDKGKKRGTYAPRKKNTVKEIEKARKAIEKARKKAEREARAEARAERKAEREAKKAAHLAKLSEDERKKREIAERVRKLSSALGKDKEYMRNLIDDIDALPGVQINEKSQTLSVKSELSKEELFALDKKVRKLEDVVEDTKKRLESMVGTYEVQKMSMQDIYDQVNARSFMDDSFEKLKEHYYATIEDLQTNNNIRTAEYNKMWAELQDLGSQYREATSYTDLLNLIDKIREISELRIN